jgi:hypothetical protein
MAAYAVFSLVIAQRKSLSMLRPRERNRAEAALVKAINQLALFMAKLSRERTKLASAREFAAMANPKASLRPPSLPPLRVG